MATEQDQARIAALEGQVAQLEQQLATGLRQKEILGRVNHRLDELLFESRLTAEIIELGHQHRQLDPLAHALLEMLCTFTEASWAVLCVELDGQRMRDFAVNVGAADLRVAHIACQAAMRGQLEPGLDHMRILLLGSQEGRRGAIAVPATSDAAQLALYEFFAFRFGLPLERAVYFEGVLEVNRLKDEFLHAVSHELRTPLNVIQGFLFLLQHHKEPPDSPKVHEWLAEAVGGSKQLERVVKELLDYSMVLAGRITIQREVVRMASILDELVPQWEAMLHAQDQVLELVLPEDIPSLWAEGRRVRQILMHLVATSSAHAGRNCSIRLEIRALEGEVSFHISNDGEPEAQLEVGDWFSHFRAVDVPGGDTRMRLGLGLVVSRGLAEAHGGGVGVHADRQQGTVFSCHLPTVQGQVGAGSSP